MKRTRLCLPDDNMENEGRGMYCLKSANYPGHLTSGLVGLLEDTDCSLTDVTLGCEGQFIQAHRVVLAVSSPFFKEFFRINRVDGRTGNVLIVLTNVKFGDLRNIVKFMYAGTVTISNIELGSFLDAAKILQIQGLTTESTDLSGTGIQRSENCGNDSDSRQYNIDSPHPHGTGSSSRSNTFSVNQIKRSRMTETSPSTTASRSTLSPSSSSILTAKAPQLSQLPCSSAGAMAHHQQQNQNPYDPLEDEHQIDEDVNEEMINLDAVKPERIEVYSTFESEPGVDPMCEAVGAGPGTLGGSGVIGYSGLEPTTRILERGIANPGQSSVMHNLSQQSRNPGSSSSAKPAGQYLMCSSPVYSSPSIPTVLDGTYFQIVSLDHSAEGIPAKAACLTCRTVVKGRLHPTSNFTTHLKKQHADVFKSYEIYIKTKKMGKVN